MTTINTHSLFDINTDTYEPFWDRQSPTGRSLSPFPSYLVHLRSPTPQGGYPWFGEYELLAAAAKWNLRFIILRPGKSTVIIGNGNVKLWCFATEDHMNPVRSAKDPVTQAKRDAHCKDVAVRYSLTKAPAL